MFTVVQEQDLLCSKAGVTRFDGLKRGTYNFRLVCYYWAKVASRTPELWRFWGNTLNDWEMRCHHARSLVDLLLDEDKIGQELSVELAGNLKDCANQDMIRRICLRSDSPDLLDSILTCIKPDGEGVQEKRIESLIINTTSIPRQLSKLFTRLYLPLLQHFEIIGTPETQLWHNVTSSLTGTNLTTLSLQTRESSFPLTTPQLLPILNANPNLQDLILVGVLPHEIEGIRIQRPCLSHLRKINFCGKFRSVFQLLELLEPPAQLDYIKLVMEDSTPRDINQKLVPYMGKFFQSHDGFKEPLSVTTSTDHLVSITVETIRCLEGEGPVQPFAKFSLSGVDDLDLKPLAINLMKYVPQEHVELLKMDHTSEIPEDFFNAMPRLNYLWLVDVDLLDGFMQSNSNEQPPGWEPLPSLQSLCLQDVLVENDDWQPLITYLEHQCSGNQTLLLEVKSLSNMPQEVLSQVQDLVGNFEYNIVNRD